MSWGSVLGGYPEVPYKIFIQAQTEKSLAGSQRPREAGVSAPGGNLLGPNLRMHLAQEETPRGGGNEVQEMGLAA